MSEIYNISSNGLSYFTEFIKFLDYKKFNQVTVIVPTKAYSLGLETSLNSKNFQFNIIIASDLQKEISLRKCIALSLIYFFLKDKGKADWETAEKILANLSYNYCTIENALLEKLSYYFDYKNYFQVASLLPTTTIVIALGLFIFTPIEKEILLFLYKTGVIILHNIEEATAQQKFFQALSVPSNSSIIQLNTYFDLLPFSIDNLSTRNINLLQVHTSYEQIKLVKTIFNDDPSAQLVENTSFLTKWAQCNIREQTEDKLATKFILLTLDFFLQNYDSLTLLHILKHPFMFERFYNEIQEIEIKKLRKIHGLNNFKKNSYYLSAAADQLLDKVKHAFSYLENATIPFEGLLNCLKILVNKACFKQLKYMLEQAQFYINFNFSILEYRQILVRILPLYFSSKVNSERIQLSRDILITQSTHLVITQLLPTDYFVNTLLNTLHNIKITIINKISDPPSALLIALNKNCKSSAYVSSTNTHFITRPESIPSLKSVIFALSCKMIVKLIQDPHSFYKRYVLQLKSLPPIDPLPNKFEFNKILYNVLTHLPTTIENAEFLETQLINLSRALIMQQFQAFKYSETLWLPKITSIIKKFITYLVAIFPNTSKIESGLKYKINILGVELFTKCDFLIYTKKNTVSLVNYTLENSSTKGILSAPLIKAVIISKQIKQPITEIINYCENAKKINCRSISLDTLQKTEEQIKFFIQKFFF